MERLASEIRAAISREAFAEAAEMLYVTRTGASLPERVVCMVCGQFKDEEHQANCPVIELEARAKGE
jgi:hypothetical protein